MQTISKTKQVKKLNAKQKGKENKAKHSIPPAPCEGLFDLYLFGCKQYAKRNKSKMLNKMQQNKTQHCTCTL